MVKSHLGTGGKCLSKGVGQDMGRGRLFTPIFTVGTGREERGGGGWCDLVTGEGMSHLGTSDYPFLHLRFHL